MGRQASTSCALAVDHQQQCVGHVDDEEVIHTNRAHDARAALKVAVDDDGQQRLGRLVRPLPQCRRAVQVPMPQ